MVHSKKAWFAVAALAAATTLTLAGCGGGGGNDAGSTGSAAPAGDYKSQDCAADATSANTLKVGTILPQTGTLAFLGPPEIAGVGLAVNDIVAAGDKACTFWTDSGDSTDMAVSSASADKLIDAKVSVAIGAASSSVSLNVVDKLAAAPIVEVSPANTSAELSGKSPFYFRTAPPDTVQGSALGQLIVGDGHQKVAFLVFNDSYGTGLRDVIEKTVEDAGGTVTYGGKGKGQEFPPGQTTFSSEVTAAIASKPDAIVVIAFDETKAIVPELVSQSWDMKNTYYTDGNTSDYSKVFDKGTLEGAKGTIPGANPADDFKKRMSDWHQSVQGSALSDYSYGAESYDATILSALAAKKGGATDPTTIQKNMAAVSGAQGGTECSSYKECADLITKGESIHYKGVSGVGPFNAKNDPSSAFIGIYQFDADNKPIWQSAVEGKS